MSSRLFLTVTGVHEDSLVDAQHILDSIRACTGVKAGVSFTVNANGHRLADSPATLEFLHESAARGHELLLAGLGDVAVNRPFTAARSRKPSAPGEFQGLGVHESCLRLSAAGRQLDHVGLTVDSFAPANWALSEGAREAAQTAGFRTAADVYSITDFATSKRHRIRVLAFGDGFGTARWWRRHVAHTVNKHIGAGADVRLSVNAEKAGVKRLVSDVVELATLVAQAGYQPWQYRDVSVTESGLGGALFAS